MTTKANENAFPDSNPDAHDESFNGLTKREYFAAMALQGLLAANDNKMTFEARVEAAVMYADDLIDELNVEASDE